MVIIVIVPWLVYEHTEIAIKTSTSSIAKKTLDRQNDQGKDEEKPVNGVESNNNNVPDATSVNTEFRFCTKDPFVICNKNFTMGYWCVGPH